MGTVIEGAWRRGARLDSWDEHFDFAKWQAAMEKTGTDLTSIVGREIPPDAPEPWSHIVCHRSRQFLLEEHRRMKEALAGS